MTTRRHYANSPITEAIIDLRVKLPENVKIGDLEPIHDRIRSQYPNKENRTLARGRFEVGRGVSASASSQSIGFFFKSEDERQIVQARLDGFTMSRLAPYESWRPFRDEARRLWDLYRETVCPEAVERLAVRYINRLDIPKPFDDLNEYLRTFPEVSPDLPQGLSGLFMQLTVPQADIKSMLQLTEALIEPNRPEVVSIVLDVDVFRTDDIPSDDDAVWDFFEVLRNCKNDVFEACVTPKARELFA